METKKALIPHFETVEQEAEYWETHSPLDLAKDPVAEEVRATASKDRVITIRLDTATRNRLDTMAQERGVGPSSLARSLLVSSLERSEQLPKVIKLEDLDDLLREIIPESVAAQAESLMLTAAVGDPQNPSALVIDGSQINELEEMALKIAKAMLAYSGTEILVVDSTKMKDVKALVQANSAGGR